MTKKELLITFSFCKPAMKGNTYLPPLLGDSRDRGGGAAGGVLVRGIIIVNDKEKIAGSCEVVVIGVK